MASHTGSGSINPGQQSVSDNNVVSSGTTQTETPIIVADVEAQANRDFEENSPEINRYKSLVKRFTIKVALSTFACALIVTYCAFVNTVVTTLNRRHIALGIPFNLGLLLSFIAIGFHAGSTILAGRCAVLCSNPEQDRTKRPPNYFTNVLHLCNHLHLYGTLFFVVAVLETSFLLFDSYIYPGVFMGVSVLGLVLFFWTKYKEVSLVYMDIMFMKQWVKRWCGGGE